MLQKLLKGKPDENLGKKASDNAKAKTALAKAEHKMAEIDSAKREQNRLKAETQVPPWQQTVVTPKQERTYLQDFLNDICSC